MLLRSTLSNTFFLLLLSAFSFAQHLPVALTPKLTEASQEKNILADRRQWKEIVSARTEYSSSYEVPGNRVIIQYSKLPLNYYKNDQLVPVDLYPQRTEDGLAAAGQPVPVAVSNSGSVTIGREPAQTITFSDHVTINNTAVASSPLEMNDLNAIQKNILPGIDKTFEFRFGSLKYNYVLNQPPQTSAGDLVIGETIVLPGGSEIKADMESGYTEKGLWKGNLSVLAAGGQEIGSMRGAVCYDADQNYFLAGYELKNVNGVTKVNIVVDAAWINSPSRKYPVTIDPLVTTAVSVWVAGNIPSCIAPMDHADSIPITIPPQITVTGFFVSGSYYANPFTTAVMSDGEMFFSTSCAQSTTFTVAAPIGSTAGTGYLTNYDLRSPLVCCFPQSCSPQSLWLKMHLRRSGPGTGCNTTYIYHDPFSGYPFSVYVEGHTVEAYASQWNVIPASVCANTCTITGNVYIRYGVPPFTITHPWMSGSVTGGTPAGCSFANTIKLLTLTVPGCPLYCDTTSSLSVPPPTVVDACGNLLTGMMPEVIVLKPAPDVVATPDPVTACSGIPFSVALSSCFGGANYSWTSIAGSGTGNINGTIINSSSSSITTAYNVSADLNGCSSDTMVLNVNVDPSPVAGFSVDQPVIVELPSVFNDNTVTGGGPVNSWSWTFGDGLTSGFENPVHTYTTPGVYPVCLAVQTNSGCIDTVCQDITVVPAELDVPNVITPNGDNINDFLFFKNLEFFGASRLTVFDRWGQTIYEKENYQNDFNASTFSDGTYFFILSTSTGKTYPGFVQVIHN